MAMPLEQRVDFRSGGGLGSEHVASDFDHLAAPVLGLRADAGEGLGLTDVLARHEDALGAFDDLAIFERARQVADFSLEFDDLLVAFVGEGHAREEGFAGDGQHEVGHHRVLACPLDTAERGMVRGDDGGQRLPLPQADEEVERVPVGERHAGDDHAVGVRGVRALEFGAGSADGGDLGLGLERLDEVVERRFVGVRHDHGAGQGGHGSHLRNDDGPRDSTEDGRRRVGGIGQIIAADPAGGIPDDGGGAGAGLFRIVYTSRRREGLETEEIIERIVLPSLRTNYQKRITGRIWFGPTRFFQFMEGPTADVQAVFSEIQDDSRHEQLRVLATGPVETRLFDRYSMKVIEGDEAAAIAKLIALHAAPGMDVAVRSASPDPPRTIARAVLAWLERRRGPRARAR